MIMICVHVCVYYRVCACVCVYMHMTYNLESKPYP